MNIQDKVIIVTGGAVRLGKAICLELAGRGARLFCHYHTSEQAALELVREIEKEGSRAALFRGDLQKAATAKELVRQALQTFGRIDALVNNAAVFYKTPLGEVREEDWNSFFDLNLKSVFFLSQEVSRYMLAQKKGRIVNIGDAGALKPFPAYLPYSVSKAGIVTLTQGLAKALAPHIQVNCINPGPVLMPETMPEAEKEFAVQQTLLQREGAPADVARAVRFLLEEGDYITGAVIPVDGGRHIK